TVDIIRRALHAPRALRLRDAALAAGGPPALMHAVAEYLGALQSERGASRNTLAAYRRDLQDFLTHLQSRRLAPDAPSPADVVTWLEHLPPRRLAPPTRAPPPAAPPPL